MKDILALSAALLAILATIPYLRDIVKGQTKPNVVSWFTWALLLLIATLAAFSAHETRTGLLTLGDLIGTTLTLLLGLKYGIAKLSWFDGLCQLGALVALILWFIFDSPLIAILAAIGIDLIAALPTLRHSWLKPLEETWQTFFLIVIASILTLLSLSHFSPTSLSFPIYLLLINLAITLIVVGRRRKNQI